MTTSFNPKKRASYLPGVRGLTDAEEAFKRCFNLIPDLVCVMSRDGFLTQVNNAWETTLGYKAGELEGSWLTEIIHGEDIAQTLVGLADQITGSRNSVLNRCRTRWGEYRWLEWNATPTKDSGWMYATARDVTARTRADELAAASLKIVGRLNLDGNLEEIIGDLLKIIRNYTGCGAAGIRLKNGDDYPYYQSAGFSDEHLKFENQLCQVDALGQTVKDCDGNPVLECMCGNILKGRFDPEKPFFTTGGSFWSNCTTNLLGSTTEADRQARTRNYCNGEGYESVALIPLINQSGTIIGLLQLNDIRTNRFNPEMIQRLEQLARHIAIVIERKQAEKELKEREEHLRLATQGAELGTYTFDFLNGEANWSPGLKALLGLKADENMALDSNLVVDSIYPTDKAEFLSLMTTANTPGGDGTLKMDYRVIHPDGSLHWLRVHGRTEFSGEGEARRAWRAAGVVTDITQNKTAEEKLKKSEAKFSQLFNIVQVPLAICELKDMKFVDVNKSFIQNSGLSREEIIGKPATSLNWNDPAAQNEFTQKIRKTGKIKDFELQICNQAGELRTVLMWAEVVNLAGQECMLASGIDITHRKKMEEALKESEEKYRALFENSIDAVILGAPDGSVYAANPEACRMFGMTESELIQAGLPGISDLSDPAWETAMVERTKTSRFKGELRFKRANGSNFIGEISSSFFTNSKGEITSSIIIRDISERKKMEKDLKESEQRFRTLIEMAPAPIGISRNGKTTYVNHHYSQLFGFEKPEELYGHPLVEQIAPQCRAEITERAQQREQGMGVLSEYESIGLRKDGSQFPFIAAVTRIDLSTGPASMAIFTDITELKRIQTSQQESEAKYRGLFEQMVSGFALHEIILDDEGKAIDYVTLEVNREYELLLNTSREAVVGQRAYQAVPGLDKHWIELFGSVVLTGQPRRYTQYASNLDKWFEGQAFRVSPGRFAVTFIDVTEQKRAEQELKESEIKFRTVADYTYNWEYWRGADGGFKYVSPSCERVTGYKSEEFVQNPDLLKEIIHPKDKPRTIEHLMERRSDITSLDFRIITRTGETRWIGHSCQPIFGPDGRWLGQRASNRDITRRIQMEQDLARSQEQLAEFTAYLQEAIEIEKTSLSREIHDELGQLLTGLKIDLDWVFRRLPAEWEAIRQKIKTMSGLIDKADTVVKKIAADLRPVLLDDLGLVEALKWWVDQFSSRSGVKCRLKFTPEDLTLDHDRSLDVYRVVQELLTNVSRHAQANLVTINLRIEKETLVLEVKDNGIGLPEEKISDPHSFGLIGIKERVRRWKGSVEIRSIQGKGTTVNVNIPLAGENND